MALLWVVVGRGSSRAIPLLVAAALGLVAAVPAQAQAQPVLSGLEGPVDFALLPDGSVWWLEYYSGNVSRQDLATGERDVLFHVEPVMGGERGVVGLGVDQASADNGTFYLYYTVAEEGDRSGGINRLSRIDDGVETVLLTTTAAVRHNGGRILLHPDGSLFVSTGENDLGQPAQDPDSLLGKILHLDPDGTAAAGNPHGRVYSLGHRNVYGLAFDPASGRLFATENGNAERDEVNEILPGRNYGWPDCEGTVRFDFSKQDDVPGEPCDEPAFTAPLQEFYATTTAAPTGAAILAGRLYWASWNEGSIHRLDETADGAWKDTKVYQYGGRINDLEAGLDGRSLYYSNWTHIVRLEVPEPAGVAKLQPKAGSDAGQAPLATRDAEAQGQDRGSPAGSAAAVAVVLAALAVAVRSRPRA